MKNDIDYDNIINIIIIIIILQIAYLQNLEQKNIKANLYSHYFSVYRTSDEHNIGTVISNFDSLGPDLVKLSPSFLTSDLTPAQQDLPTHKTMTKCFIINNGQYHKTLIWAIY